MSKAHHQVLSPFLIFIRTPGAIAKCETSSFTGFRKLPRNNSRRPASHCRHTSSRYEPLPTGTAAVSRVREWEFLFDIHPDECLSRSRWPPLWRLTSGGG